MVNPAGFRGEQPIQQVDMVVDLVDQQVGVVLASADMAMMEDCHHEEFHL